MLLIKSGNHKEVIVIVDVITNLMHGECKEEDIPIIMENNVVTAIK